MSTYALNNDKKHVNLSPLEHKIYFDFYDQEIFRTEDAYKIIDNKKTARQVLFRLKNKGYIKQMKRGIYFTVPAQLVGKEYTPDRILIASIITMPYFLSHHTALEVHGVAQSFFNITYISTNKILKPFDYQGITYKTVTTKYLFGAEMMTRGTAKIMVSDRERTTLDCIRNIGYAGGLEELIKSIAGFPSLDYNKLFDYLHKFSEDSLFHRTGFILDSIKDELNVPPWFLNRVKRSLGRRTYYLTKEKGKFVKDWNIIVPENIKERMKIV